MVKDFVRCGVYIIGQGGETRKYEKSLKIIDQILAY